MKPAVWTLFSMTLSQRANCQAAIWREAVRKLPRPLRGEMRVSDGVRFCTDHWVDDKGHSFLSWEVCNDNWEPTGVTFGCWNE